MLSRWSCRYFCLETAPRKHGIPRYVAGEVDLYDGRRLYINRGLGVVKYPVRFNARPEITVFTLRRDAVEPRPEGERSSTVPRKSVQANTDPHPQQVEVVTHRAPASIGGAAVPCIVVPGTAAAHTSIGS
jgi:hypothetical protein